MSSKKKSRSQSQGDIGISNFTSLAATAVARDGNNGGKKKNNNKKINVRSDSAGDLHEPIRTSTSLVFVKKVMSPGMRL